MGSCTIYRDIYEKVEGYFITVDHALNRIKTGRSKHKVDEIRSALDKDRADKLKRFLPSVCFSGEFYERFDDKLKKHSGYICIDFDHVEDLRDKQTDIINHDFIYACWISPSGKGLKALVKVADGKKHRQHFQALQDIFPEIDKSGINESRVCFESFDPEMYINSDAKVFKKIKEVEKFEQKETVSEYSGIFDNLLKWLSNKGDAFVTGERNFFVFKLASACCRFGVPEPEAATYIKNSLNLNDNGFTVSEAEKTIKSAYRANKTSYGTAIFEKDVLVEKTTRKEIEIDASVYDLEVKPKDVVYGEDVKEQALNIFNNGYERLNGIGCEIDEYFKLKSGELTLLSGIGNYGKSTYLIWYLLMRVILYKDKFAFFSPENNPPEEFYHDCVEIILQGNCTPSNPNRPPVSRYNEVYEFVSKHIFYIYPKDATPTPEYLKERFFELVIKEKITGCIIDPFNQMANDYGKAGGRSDKYLEDVFSQFLRFSQTNNLFFIIVAHPKQMTKQSDGNYPMPDVFDIADGAMWNNKMDNILIYHRPVHQTQPDSPMCLIASKKIRRQKIVGKKGELEINYLRGYRRFSVNGKDPMDEAIKKAGLKFLIEFEEAPF